MRSHLKVFFLGVVVFVFYFLPVLAGQSDSDRFVSFTTGFQLDALRGEEDDLVREKWLIPNLEIRAKDSLILSRIEQFKRDRISRLGDPDLKQRAFPFYNSGNINLLPEAGFSINLQNQKTIQEGIIDDFLVNDDERTVSHINPAIAMDNSDAFILTWLDGRKGILGVYAQRYNSSGSPIGSNFKVNSEYTTPAQWYPPDIAMDGWGNFIITWTGSNYDIYAQRFDSSGTPIGANFKVNVTYEYFFPMYSAVAIDGSGSFVVTWEVFDYFSGFTDIYAQIFNSSGVPLGSNFKVDDEAGNANQYYPAIDMDNSGDFVITWMDYRKGNWDIYSQRYDFSGAALGANFKVNDDTGTADQWVPDIAMDSWGNFAIVWEDNRNGNFDIYHQLYYSSGTPLYANRKVNDDTGTSYQSYPAIDIDGTSSFVIAWSDYRNGNWDIYAQKYISFGLPAGSNFKLNDDSGLSSQTFPAVAMGDTFSFVACWIDFRENSNGDIYAQRCMFGIPPLGSNFRVNEVEGTTDQMHPALALDGTGRFFIAWQDERNGYLDIYAQRYSSSGLPLGFNFWANNQNGPYLVVFPDMAADSSGNLIIAWEDAREAIEPIPDIFGQRYDSSGVPHGSNFMVNDDSAVFIQSFPSVAKYKSGEFIIAWQDLRNLDLGRCFDIYAQRYSSAGNGVGSNFRVSEDFGGDWQVYPDIATDGSDNFVITWADKRNYNFDIYAQRYDFSGAALGTNFKVNDESGNIKQWVPAIAMNGLGNFVIVWQDSRNGNWDIYAQRYDSSGNPTCSNFKVNDDSGTADQLSPVIAMDGTGRFVIAWEDLRNGNSDIYAQIYNSSGVPSGTNYLVPNPQYSSFVQKAVDIVADNSNIYFTWQDNRRGNWDIYAKVVDWNWTDVKDEQVTSLPNSFELSQNYPNPFNPTTTIHFRAGSKELVAGSPVHEKAVSSSQFMVHSPVHTTLKVYNILGQLVRTLVDEEKLPGNYNVLWDGKDDSGKEVASGIYFYRLKTKDFVETKKMVLLR